MVSSHINIFQVRASPPRRNSTFCKRGSMTMDPSIKKVDLDSTYKVYKQVNHGAKNFLDIKMIARSLGLCVSMSDERTERCWGVTSSSFHLRALPRVLPLWLHSLSLKSYQIWPTKDKRMIFKWVLEHLKKRGESYCKISKSKQLSIRRARWTVFP